MQESVLAFCHVGPGDRTQLGGRCFLPAEPCRHLYLALKRLAKALFPADCCSRRERSGRKKPTISQGPPGPKLERALPGRTAATPECRSGSSASRPPRGGPAPSRMRCRVAARGDRSPAQAPPLTGPPRLRRGYRLSMSSVLGLGNLAGAGLPWDVRNNTPYWPWDPGQPWKRRCSAHGSG